MGKKIIISIILLLCGLGIGYFFSPKSSQVIIKKADITNELRKIDSLDCIIKEKDIKIDSLNNNVRVIKEYIPVKVKEIQELELTPSVELLRENLITYGELTLPEDDYPSAVLPDSMIMLNQTNVKDVNTIVEKYKVEMEINKNLEGIIEEDFSIIQLQKEQLVLKDSIQFKKDKTYEENIQAMNNKIKESGKKYKKALIIGGIVGAVLLGTNFIR